MRRWGDVVKRIAASDMALGSFIRGSAAFECDGCLYVVFDKPFGISLMNDKRKSDVSSAIKEATGKDFPPEKSSVSSMKRLKICSVNLWKSL